MSNKSLYDIASGVLSGVIADIPDNAVAINTPDGCAWFDGVADHLCQRVDLRPDDHGNATIPVLVDYIPPKPADDAMQTWAWDAESKRWVAARTVAAVAADVRALRDQLMSDSDWVTLRAMRTGQPVPADWAAYLQALADVPAQAGFPLSVTWPTPPSP